MVVASTTDTTAAASCTADAVDSAIVVGFAGFDSTISVTDVAVAGSIVVDLGPLDSAASIVANLEVLDSATRVSFKLEHSECQELSLCQHCRQVFHCFRIAAVEHLVGFG